MNRKTFFKSLFAGAAVVAGVKLPKKKSSILSITGSGTEGRATYFYGPGVDIKHLFSHDKEQWIGKASNIRIERGDVVFDYAEREV